MPTANPLEQLRRRMLSHASPAAFAAAAEEHRRAGRFADAIAVCRDGLERYPAYASARVTLGRALLDSGDVAAAVTELEHAVAQAPDNLAASRALEAARAQLALEPPDPVAEADAALSGFPKEDDDTGEFAVPGLPASRQALQVGPDSPQEFGLGPDWLPAGPPAAAAVAVTAPDGAAAFELPSIDGWQVDPPEADPLNGEEAAMTFASLPLQGEEPAGIWALPPDVPVADSLGAADYSWGVDAAEPSDVSASDPIAAMPPTAGMWDAAIIDDAVQEVPPQAAPEAFATDLASAAPDGSADPGGTGDWRGLFVEPVSDGAAPSAFSGWDASGPTAPEPPAWADAPEAEPVTSAFTVPGLWGAEAPADVASPVDPWQGAAAVETPLPPASAIPDWSVPVQSVDLAQATPEAMGEWTMMVAPAPAPVLDVPAASEWTSPAADEAAAVAWQSVPAGDSSDALSDVDPVSSVAAAAETVAATTAALSLEDSLQVVDAGPPGGREEETASIEQAAPPVATIWSGSVASALEEVFARAGQEHPAPASLEPPAHPCEQVREAMASAAVEATLEDVAQRTDTLPPALVSLQQMLDAVRARRAALHADMKH